MTSVDEAAAEPERTTDPLGFSIRLGILAITYIAAARFGIQQDVAHGVITPVWAPSGIAIAFLVLFGPRYALGVAIGALVANATSGVTIVTAGAIAIGNTLEALVAQKLLRRVNFSPSLARVRDVLWFVILAAVVATTVSATIGVTSLTVAGELNASRGAQEWLLWWFGDLIGALVVAPVILTWVTALRERRWPGRPAEALFLAVVVTATALVIFVGGSWKYPYVIFPLLVWAALRFQQLGATTAIAVVGAIATWGTANGAVPIGGASATQAVQILQALIAVVALGTFVTAATIAERDAAENARSGTLEQLLERNAMYETVLQAVSNLGEGFVVTDAGRLIYANPAYCAMTGYTFEELIEMPSLLELAAPEQREVIADRLRTRMAGREVIDHYEAALIRKDGRRVECEVGVELAQTPLGPRIVSVIRDVTERKRVESFRENFISYAAHELRGPIANISGFVRVLRQPAPLEEKERMTALERLGANVRTMQARVENMLALTQIERHEASLRPQMVDIDRFFRGVADTLPPTPGKSLDATATPGITAWIDWGALEQIITNLVTNAYRYGGSRVKLAARSSDGRTVLEVSDDGPGVPTDEIASVFEPFVRGRGGSQTDGAGLGLSIVRALAEASGGDITYRYEDGLARFVVTLPSAQAENG